MKKERAKFGKKRRKKSRAKKSRANFRREGRKKEQRAQKHGLRSVNFTGRKIFGEKSPKQGPDFEKSDTF